MAGFGWSLFGEFPALPSDVHMSSIAFALRLRLGRSGRGTIKNANSGNRGARRRAGRLRVEFSGDRAGLHLGAGSSSKASRR